MHPTLARVTDRIVRRSAGLRGAYLARIDAARLDAPARSRLGCGNLAHGFAAAGADKPMLRGGRGPNLAIVSAYNDMLSAHQPMEHYPALIRMAARNAGGAAQFAGGVPAMCDGVTQGRAGMELSLFSRDVIAMSTAIALSHEMFDAALLLGVCDKIVPGLLIGALSYGHLPVILVPCRADDLGPAECREGARAPGLCRRQGQPRGIAGCGSRQLPQRRHLHLLRHRQFQPDAAGDDGPACCRAAPSSIPARRCAMR
jgi:dihydroxyacid dehydratase/phosphogluconate dehydratase